MGSRPSFARFLTCLEWVLAVTSFAIAPAAGSLTLTFTTSDTEILPDTDNQGWYTSHGEHLAQNDNYLIGHNGADSHRNFFLFDLSGLDLTGQVVTSATLEVRRYSSSADYIFDYGLFDIDLAATPPATLLAGHPLDDVEGVAIYQDLGSGTSYGGMAFDPALSDPDDLLVFPLAVSALADITTAAGGFFGIGGAITNLEFNAGTIHGGSGGEVAAPPPFVRDPGIQRLVIEVVPESSALVLIGAGLVALAAFRRR